MILPLGPNASLSVGPRELSELEPGAGQGPETRFQTRVALKGSSPANAVIPKSKITSLEKVWELLF
jgi:hypothetical protein